jgi:hypothetical protein
MNLPGFTAEAALHKASGDFRFSPQSAHSIANGVIPAIPFCGNCDQILDRCEENGFRPRAVCLACLTGNCFSGVEKPPQLLDPFGQRPGGFSGPF